MFPISSCEISLCKMYFIGIVSDCMSRKIIRSTPNLKNLFRRTNEKFVKLFVHPSHRRYFQKQTSRTSVAFKIEEWRCPPVINISPGSLKSTNPRSSKNSLFFISPKCCCMCMIANNTRKDMGCCREAEKFRQPDELPLRRGQLIA